MKSRLVMSFACLLTSNLLAADQADTTHDYRAEKLGIELPATAEKRLLEVVHSKRIVYVRLLAFARERGFDYLGLFAGFEIIGSFESVWHQQLVLRKKSSEPDWSKAELFGTDDLTVLFHQPMEEELDKALHPWPPK